MPKKSGFTLIELLVTISIIAILSTIGIVVYSSVLKQGRDSKRLSDLRSIQSALEQYFADQFYYPTAVTAGIALSAGGKIYINIVPSDPTGSPYGYIPSPSGCDNSVTKCTNYCLYANLENSSSSKPATCTDGSYNFALTPP